MTAAPGYNASCCVCQQPGRNIFAEFCHSPVDGNPGAPGATLTPVIDPIKNGGLPGDSEFEKPTPFLVPAARILNPGSRKMADFREFGRFATGVLSRGRPAPGNLSTGYPRDILSRGVWEFEPSFLVPC